MNKLIKEFQEKLASLAELDNDPASCTRLSALESKDQLYLDFFGSPFDEPYQEFCKILIHSEIAARLASLSLRSPIDEGSNGTRNWDLSLLVEGNVLFQSLQSFHVEQNEAGAHNRVIIGSNYYDEAGVLGKLLRKAPALNVLVVPSAPDATFFTVENHPLTELNVDAGYDTNGFVSNLATSMCFPKLHTLEFGEFNETYIEDFLSRCTSFDEYRQLFTSQQFANVKNFVWRNPVCSDEQMMELRSLHFKTELTMKIVNFSSRYI